jgi:hypothetical protein
MREFPTVQQKHLLKGNKVTEDTYKERRRMEEAERRGEGERQVASLQAVEPR